MRYDKITGDIDHTTVTRTIYGRLTKSRVKSISRYTRTINNQRIQRCGHDYDCCGCVCNIKASVSFTRYSATVTKTVFFNY